MLIFANPHHALHSARHEMYRGKLVPVHEVPARLDFVVAELARRPVGELRAAPPPVTQGQLERVHARRYLEFLKTAWTEWVALDPANAGLDALPSVWPVRGFRADVEPDNFAARMGLYSFDAGTPLVAGTWAAVETGAACAVAAAQALRRGRQYLRQISADGVSFGPPGLRSLVPWSRLFADGEVVCAMNTDPLLPHTAWVTVDAGLHAPGSALVCRYSTEPGQEGGEVVVEARNGSAVLITVPAAGFAIYA